MIYINIFSLLQSVYTSTFGNFNFGRVHKKTWAIEVSCFIKLIRELIFNLLENHCITFHHQQ